MEEIKMKKLLLTALTLGMMSVTSMSALAAGPGTTPYVCPNGNAYCVTNGSCINDGQCQYYEDCYYNGDGDQNSSTGHHGGQGRGNRSGGHGGGRGGHCAN